MRKTARYYSVPSWEEQYRLKLVKAEEAAQEISDGDTVSLSAGVNVPRAFQKALCKRVMEKNFRNVNLVTSYLVGEYDFVRPEYKDKFTIYSGFFGSSERSAAANGNAFYVPFNLAEGDWWMRNYQPRVMAVTVAPPNKDGWMSRAGWGGWSQRYGTGFQNPAVELVVVEVNETLPFVLGDLPGNNLGIHVSEVDYIIENTCALPEIKSIPATAAEMQIAGYISEYVRDGACLQLGIGGLADAVGAILAHSNRKDLGIHTEAIGNALVPLMEKGVVNNSKKNLNRGYSVACYLSGDKDLWKFAHYNEKLRFCEVSYCNDFKIITQHDNVVSINNAMEVDLTGQVCSEAIGPRQFSGTGGQLQWVLASQFSKGGQSFIAVNSTFKAKDGTLQSKIKTYLTPGSIITTPRTLVQYIVTEYGVADLKFKTTRHRALEMIKIAHPDFRDQLTFEAKQMGLLA